LRVRCLAGNSRVVLGASAKGWEASVRIWRERLGVRGPSSPDILPSRNPAQDRKWLLDRLVAFNESRTGPSSSASYVILLYDRAGGRPLGGLAGVSFYDWFYVELVFVPEHLRHAGWGSKLIRQAEAEAVRRNCVGVWLDTYGFQARGFYEKHGYEVFGVLDDHPRGTQRAFMRKTFG
jgi:GNAT superfamily N-acetyltransferase